MNALNVTYIHPGHRSQPGNDFSLSCCNCTKRNCWDKFLKTCKFSFQLGKFFLSRKATYSSVDFIPDMLDRIQIRTAGQPAGHFDIVSKSCTACRVVCGRALFCINTIGPFVCICGSNKGLMISCDPQYVCLRMQGDAWQTHNEPTAKQKYLDDTTVPESPSSKAIHPNTTISLSQTETRFVHRK